ncbi:hypothetical protein EIP91_003916 [Steccherinum ochraceum]|uniref:Uncharacterized protein n=1 Tax=Steccherinum ochraceum TaxID=92696 RepID=A0A4R0RI54_9APHY|nr:hypothetical protein EIP91_003916 [Steccherinum ochraceum]
MDAASLKALSRAELQLLARDYGVPGNLKSVKIITRILRIQSTIQRNASNAPSAEESNRQPRAPSPSLGPDHLSHPLPTPTAASHYVPPLPQPEAPVAGPSMPRVAESISHSGLQNLEEENHDASNSAGHATPPLSSPAVRHRTSSPGTVPDFLSTDDDFAQVESASQARLARAAAYEGLPPSDDDEYESEDENLADDGDLEYAVKTLRNISVDHLQAYKRLVVMLDDAQEARKKAAEARRLAAQERNNRERLMNCLVHWTDIGPKWTDKDIYKGDIAAVEYSDGGLEELFSDEEVPAIPEGATPPPRDEPVGRVVKKAAEVWGVVLSSSPKPVLGKRSHDEEAVEEGQDDEAEDADDERSFNPFVTKRARLNAPAPPTASQEENNDDAHVLSTLSEGPAADGEQLQYADLPDRPQAPEPEDSYFFQSTSRAQSGPDSSPPRLTAAQKGKGRIE